jgi:hypothetical protein
MTKRGRGRPRALDADGVAKVWWYYRNTTCNLEQIATHVNCSAQTVSQVLSCKGAYRERPAPPETALTK